MKYSDSGCLVTVQPATAHLLRSSQPIQQNCQESGRLNCCYISHPRQFWRIFRIVWCEMQRAAVHLKLSDDKGRLPSLALCIGPSPVSGVTGVGVKCNELLLLIYFGLRCGLWDVGEYDIIGLSFINFIVYLYCA